MQPQGLKPPSQQSLQQELPPQLPEQSQEQFPQQQPTFPKGPNPDDDDLSAQLTAVNLCSTTAAAGYCNIFLTPSSFPINHNMTEYHYPKNGSQDCLKC